MYSLNVPVPGRVAALARELARELPAATARVRGEHTLGVKRFAIDDPTDYSHLEAEVRQLLAGQPTFEARIDELGVFKNPPVGKAPVVYFAVESPELRRLHRTLLEEFGPVHEGIEGDQFVPHVTIARGGSMDAARRVAARDIDPIEWTVTELHFWDPRHASTVSTLSLPA